MWWLYRSFPNGIIQPSALSRKSEGKSLSDENFGGPKIIPNQTCNTTTIITVTAAHPSKYDDNGCSFFSKIPTALNNHQILITHVFLSP